MGGFRRRPDGAMPLDASQLEGEERIADAVPRRMPEDGHLRREVEMRIRVALFIVLLANGLWSVGARACPTEVAEPGAHSHGVEEAGAHVHRSAGDTSGHAPTAERDARRGLGAPEEGPDCCRADARAPVLAEATTGSLPMGQLSLAVLSTPRLDPPRAPVLPSSARLRLGQPPPLPYARSRRPLVI